MVGRGLPWFQRVTGIRVDFPEREPENGYTSKEAAGAQIPNPDTGGSDNKYNIGLFRVLRIGMRHILNPLNENNWRASLGATAAVIQLQ